MPLPDNINDQWRYHPVVEEGNVYITHVGLSGTRVPPGFIEDIFNEGNQKYGKEALDATYRKIEWRQISPGVWQVSVGTPN
ncbi:MAG: hypothetical protein ACRDF4_03690 [Rhabdochlamydiaceae bacterium]